MSMVPPARSMRVGAEDVRRTRNYTHGCRSSRWSRRCASTERYRPRVAVAAGRIVTMSPSALRRQIGQLLIAGFNGHQIPPEMRSMAKEFGLGGVILFARNIVEPEQ